MTLSAIAPEMFVTGMSCIILLYDSFTKKKNSRPYFYTLFTLLITGILIVYNIPTISHSSFYNSFIVDKFACGMKLTVLVLLAAILIYSRLYMQAREFFNAEFFVLSLCSLLGMMIVISCNNFLSLYLGIELFVLPLYAMIVFVKKESDYAEAAFKYFIIGSLGSGLLLYGVSLIFGATSSIDFSQISNVQTSPMLILGMLFAISGIVLEFGAVPFHMWLPDVYEGSPTTVTMIVGTIPKIAIFAVIYRLLTSAFTNMSEYWQQAFMLIALASIIIGNLFAIVQNNLKRFLAYSTISHIGFILLGLFAAPVAGFSPSIFYTIAYAFMVLAAFALIIYMCHQGFEADCIDDFRGLAKKNPWLAFLMLMTMFALAGIPPFIGFYAKLQVLQAVVTAGYSSYAIIAMLFSVVGVFYYLRIIRVMFFEDPIDVIRIRYVSSMSAVAKVLISGHGMLLLLAGIYPASLLYLCIAMLK